MKRLLLICSVLLIGQSLFAQDPHFSQYFASPLSLNPANTGFFDGNMRFAINQRQQWGNVGYKYNTTSVTLDAKIMQNRVPEDDVLAIGISGIFDNSLNGALKSNYVSASTAYHKSLDANGRQRLTVGLQFTYANVFLDYSNLTFASQYDGTRFDTSIPVAVDAYNTSTRYYDAHAGLLYAYQGNRVNWYAGVSVYHIARPTESLFTSTGRKVPFRQTVHAGSEIDLTQQSSIILSGMFMLQNGAHDQMLGATYSIKTANNDNNFNMYFGAWMRMGDSYIPYVGMDFQDFTLGINYAMPSNNTSSFKPNTAEISFVYRMGANSGKHGCPKF